MPAVVTEQMQSRRPRKGLRGLDSFTREYLVNPGEDTTYYAPGQAMYHATIPRLGDPLAGSVYADGQNFIVQEINPRYLEGSYHCTLIEVLYTPPSGTLNLANPWRRRWTSGSYTRNIDTDLDGQQIGQQYYIQAGAPINPDGSPKFTNIENPNAEIGTDVEYPYSLLQLDSTNGIYADAYFRGWNELKFTVNSTDFMGLDAGECLYLGFDATEVLDDLYEVTHSFRCNRPMIRNEGGNSLFIPLDRTWFTYYEIGYTPGPVRRPIIQPWVTVGPDLFYAYQQRRVYQRANHNPILGMF